MDQLLLQQLPSTPGVYLFKDEKGKILYVGKAKDLKKRVSSYFSHKALDSKTLQLVSFVEDIATIRVGSEIEAFLLEASLIKKHKPFYNIKLIDDKSYPLIEISQSESPAILITRKKNNLNAHYFGPYSDTTALKVVLKLLRKIFPYQSVKNHPKRKCLYYHLGLCPCIPANPEKLIEYRKNLKKIEKFLDGKKDEVIKKLEQERNAYVKLEEFEDAQSIQEKIDRIILITSDTYDPFYYMDKPDFYFQRIEKELESLKIILTPYYSELGSLNRIECYDISNISGKQATGSMVVFENGDKNTKEYRRFKIKSKDTPDDFLMMQEMLTRRLDNDSWPLPNLLVVDGGKGQVGSALKALANNKKRIPVIGLAKREEIIVVPVKTQNGFDFLEIKLPHSTPGVNLLRRIRDEAHRFAITYHRLLRKKSFIS
ncbi:MAG: excinuclease ABC subunit UvrC [Candidatus Levybacteria bacterium]|nr:excinuclease ABC subunit UvrC [Candidatus Levybacteria bacterium]